MLQTQSLNLFELLLVRQSTQNTDQRQAFVWQGRTNCYMCLEDEEDSQACC